MRILTNLTALNSYNKLKINSQSVNKSMSKLSSGLRVNTAANDSAGLAISEKMRGQIRGLSQAERNVQDAISLIQTAEGGLENIQNPPLQRIRELAVQAANDTLTHFDHEQIQQEIDSLLKHIDKVANETRFNGIELINISEPVVEESSTVIEVTVPTGGTITAGYIDVPSDTPYLEIESLFGTISGADWPDMNIYAPNGDMYGYGGIMGGSGAQTFGANASVSGATYNGYSASNEIMTFDNPLEGQWRIEIHNSGGSSPSTFNVQSNLGIDLTNVQTSMDVIKEDFLNFHTGSNSSNIIFFELVDAQTNALGIKNIDVLSHASATSTIQKVDDAIELVSGYRSQFGAIQNGLEHSLNSLTNSNENLTASESRIRDLDMAKEIMNQTKSNILLQAAQAMLAQGIQQPQSVLQLLQ